MSHVKLPSLAMASSFRTSQNPLSKRGGLLNPRANMHVHQAYFELPNFLSASMNKLVMGDLHVSSTVPDRLQRVVTYHNAQSVPYLGGTVKAREYPSPGGRDGFLSSLPPSPQTVNITQSAFITSCHTEVGIHPESTIAEEEDCPKS
ncbi:uncharacterized protein ARMOST_21274 [Armillaria ostoyae]|uniref:Uncharacterized protein n=1 Tax=Armillaria ostoyae TaxID=47428 RepID=A0A284S9M9_ARMOS|nr:uncharacterized protein ARMOST_21274 [Armillaria ostoyae]